MIKLIKENYTDTLYCVLAFDDESGQNYNSGTISLFTFKSLGDAEDFEDLLSEYRKNAEYNDEDPDEFDITGGYLDDYNYLYDYNCQGIYTSDIRDALNADNHDTSIIPGYDVVILNKQDIYDKEVMYVYNIPDKFYR